MAYVRSTTFGGAAANATGHIDLLQKLVRFLTGVDTWTTTVTGGVLLHYVRGRASSVAETWTLTCTDGATGTFSVTGSVSGVQASATVGTAYDNGKIAFTLVNRTGLAVNGDSFTVQTYASTLATAGLAWQLIRVSGTTPTFTYYLKGLGSAGADAIFVNLRSYENIGSDYYNLAITGAVGHLLTADGDTAQPGYTATQHLCLYNTGMPYLFIADGRHFKGVARVENSSYESFFAGFFLPSGLPSEYPYPLAVGGSCADADRRFSVQTGTNGARHRAFFAPNNSLVVIRKGGAAAVFQSFTDLDTATTSGTANLVAPWPEAVTNRLLYSGAVDPLYSGYILRSAVLTCGSPVDVLGDLPGVFHISGYGNAAENTLTISGADYFVVRNCWRTGFSDFAAFKLE